MTRRMQKGFTLLEMLVVVAIIGVLISVAIPVFASQLERSRESVDLANVRSAYAELMTSATMGDASLRQPDGTYRVQVSPLQQSEDGWTTDISGLSIGGVPSAQWIGTPRAGGTCTVSFDPSSGAMLINWAGSSGFVLYSLLGDLTTIKASEWWKHSVERERSFNDLRAISNDERKAADIEILRAVADYFNGLSASEAEKILGSARYDRATKSGTAMLEYGQDGGGAIRISNLDTDYQPYLADSGFNARIYVTQAAQYGGWKLSDTYTSHGHNYTDKYLFTSDEMLGSSYASNVFHNVNIKFRVDNGTIADTVVWVNGLDREGYTS